MPQPSGIGFKPAAIKILARARVPLTAKAIVERAIAAGLIDDRGGTPENTLHALLSRDIKSKGEASEFRTADGGRFTLAKNDIVR